MPLSATKTEEFSLKIDWTEVDSNSIDMSTWHEFMRPRYRDPSTGRFLTLDPFAGDTQDPLSLHKYNYGEADPVNNIDPSGLFSISGTLSSIRTGLTISANSARSAFTALRATQAFARAANFGMRIRQFFWNPRKFTTISRRYWAARGGAAGHSLHHWLIPQSAKWVPQGLRNAGFNLLNMPRIINTPLGGLNQWMGFAMRWGGRRMVVAVMVDSGIKVAIPLAAYGSYQAGKYVGSEIADEIFDIDGENNVQAVPLDLSEAEIRELQSSAERMLEQLEAASSGDEIQQTLP